MKHLELSGGRLFIATENAIISVATVSGYGESKVYRLDQQSSCLCFAAAGEYIFGGFSGKEICCWNASSGELMGTHILKKKAMSISHANSDGRDVVVVADRAGEVWFVGAPLMKSSICVAGHTASVITDMVAVANRFIVTADRDEKIRISQFPQSALIQSYCLGHTSVVASVCSFRLGPNTTCASSNLMLASTSWDHSVRLWEIETGHCCGVLNMSAAGSGPLADGHAEAEGETEVVIRVEGEGEGDENGDEAVAAAAAADEEDNAEKDYDEQSAGSYPFKVLAHDLPDGRVLLILLLRGQRAVHACIATRTGDGVSPKAFGFSQMYSWAAPDLPVDMAILPSEPAAAGLVSLGVLLPAPHYLTILSCSVDSEPTIAPSTSSAHHSLMKECLSILATLVPGGVIFTQQASVAHNPGDGQLSSGHILVKHSLDKPFNKMTGIKLDGIANAGRGRKRPIDSVGVEVQQAVSDALSQKPKV